MDWSNLHSCLSTFYDAYRIRSKYLTWQLDYFIILVDFIDASDLITK